MGAEKRRGRASSDTSALPLVQEEIQPIRRLPSIRGRRLRSTAHCFFQGVQAHIFFSQRVPIGLQSISLVVTDAEP